MSAPETTNIIQDLAEVTGLPTLAIEAGFLLILMILILVVVLVVEAIWRIKKEMVKFNLGVGYISLLLKIGIDKRKISLGEFDFRVDEWKDDTKFVVLAMLQKGLSDNEITNVVDVSRAYIKQTRKWAINEGILFKKVLR